MTISNKLTILRILMVPLFVVLYAYDLMWASAIVFIIASLTDTLDGYLARSRNEITNFGKFADPLADKILVISAIICMVEKGIIPGWALIIIITREFVISGIRMSAAAQNVVIAADKLGKIKTVTQMVAITLLLFKFENIFYVDYILFYISVFFTVLSGLSYLVKYGKVLKD